MREWGLSLMVNDRFEAVIDFDNTIEYIMDKECMDDLDFPDFIKLANELNREIRKLKRENHMWKSKYNSQVEELAECYAKLGW